MALYVSALNGGSNNHPTTSEEANGYATDFVNEGIVGSYTNTNSVAPMTGAFAVNAQGTPDMTVAVTSGVAYVDATPSGQAEQSLRVRLSANQNVTISANSSGSTKYDWLYIKIDPTNANNPNLAGDDVATLVTSRSTSNTSDDGTPPTYGLLLAIVTVANGASSITNGNIRDARAQASAVSVDTAVTTGWVQNSLPAVSSVTANGNRSYTVAFASDVSATLSEGMRLRTTRTVASTQNAFSLDGSNDYYNKTSPSGMTFTDDFSVSAWIYLTSYAIGYIASRYNGTSGWGLTVNADGTIQMRGWNASSANYSEIKSYQSVPLNRWVHIATQLDMSAFTATTTTSYVMIDGVNVPAVVARAGTNPTALVQAGNLEIGSINSGTNPFPGYIDQVAIYSAKVTQATHLAAMNQGLTGSETSLISAYSNGSTTDLAATGNNLTAQGGATTVASSWHGDRGTSTTLDYALVMAVSTTTATVQVPEGCTLPTTGGITSVSYSTQANPYGWVSDKGRWAVEYLRNSDAAQSSPSANTWYNTGTYITIPIGKWALGYRCSLSQVRSVAGTIDIHVGLSTANNSSGDLRYRYHNYTTASTGISVSYAAGDDDEQLSSAQIMYLNVMTPLASSVTSIGFESAATQTKIKAIPSNL